LEGMQWNKHTKVFKLVSVSFKVKMIHLHKKVYKSLFRSIKTRPPTFLLTQQLDQLTLILAWCSPCHPLKRFKEGIYISKKILLPLHMLMKNHKVETKIELTINVWFISGKWLEAWKDGPIWRTMLTFLPPKCDYNYHISCI
jgi:hypothetical protein